MATHALFIGVNQYADRNIRPLVCAQRDASELYHLFKRDLGYGDDAHLLEAPRVEDVHDQLEAIGQRARAGDTFCLYFAGHGYEPADGSDQYLLLGGARLLLLQQASGGAPSGTLSVKDLITLTDSWPDVGRVFMFDACRAELSPTRSLQGGVPVFGSDRVLQRLAERGGFGVGRSKTSGTKASPSSARPAPVIIKACQNGQLATELLEHGRSMFAKALDDALNAARQSGQAVLADRGLLQAVGARMAQLCGTGGASQQPWMSDGAPEVLLYLPSAAPVAKAAVPMSAPTEAAPGAASQLARLFDDFERQLQAGQFHAPISDCCVGTLALMRAAGLSEAGLARYEQALKSEITRGETPSAGISQVSKTSTAPTPAEPTSVASPDAESPSPTARPGPLRVGKWALAMASFLGLVSVLVVGGTQVSWKKADAPVVPVAAAIAAPATDANKDSYTVNGVSFRMVNIPAGSFLMGSPESEPGRKSEERQRPVKLNAFQLGQTEVTQGLWQAVMGSNPSEFKSCGSDCPVEKVSWDDAQEFIRKLNAQTGQRFRLPSEAEWEYAARAGSTTAYPWGSQASHENANYGKDDSDDCCAGLAKGRDRWVNTAPVGQFPANGYGLHDMHGNVMEWVQDCFPSDFNSTPGDGSALEACGGPDRALRGGAWHGDAQFSRSAVRGWIPPSNRLNVLGVRLARSSS